MNTTTQNKNGAYDYARQIQRDAVQAAKRSNRSLSTEIRERLRLIPVEFRTATHELLIARGLFDM